MRILFTNNTLSERAGTELYVRDLAVALRKRGHEVAAYSPELGDVADELISAGIEVANDVNRLMQTPDVLHGHHHLETMTALARFPRMPAVYVSHGWIPWAEIPPKHPRIYRYVAVDEPTRAHAVEQHGIPADRLSVIPNFVDLDRFKPRGPLPPKPIRGLVLSNYATEETHLPFVRKACVSAGIALDVLGRGIGRGAERPEEVLQQYDIVFAKGRAALEAIAVGCAVVVCDAFGAGPLVTMQNANELRFVKGDYKKYYEPLSVQAVTQQIEKYSAAEAANVSALARAVVGMDAALNHLVKLYESARAEFDAAAPDVANEARAVAAYLAWLSVQSKDQARNVAKLAKQRNAAFAEIEREKNSTVFRVRHRVLRIPVLGAWLHRWSVKSKKQ